MRSAAKKLLGVAAFIIPVLILLCFGFFYWVNYELLTNKSCNYWRQGMTKEEKILAALQWANSTNALSFEFVSPQTKETYRNLIKQVPYDSAEAILRDQPDCCHVYAKHSVDTAHPTEDISGKDEGVAVLRYLGRYKDRRTGIIHTAPAISHVDFNFCRKGNS